ncbi:hypothetical protein J421_2373 [Gemmatirosa kalamazoonensis]|jgi:hypothetical protein|uniref:Uncharacterized protein n=1 Tax=Gemmatirosa kalamazoonensis TaxID=861299 RepID=W0RHV2_9BACT|nr:hypothetical protein [Gemmatirosa kalamazoonensis]AHG89910.1 hypothetical protein J421_2373 [Gemmatirosa kalamazoonensis]
MSIFTTKQYDALERAVVDGKRISVLRSGKREVVVVPRRLRLTGGREIIEATHPTTGDRLDIYIDEIERFEVVE